MKGYAIFIYNHVADPDTMRAYAELALPAMMNHGAQFLVRAPGNTVTAREAGLCERIVVLEFASKEQALAAYNSPEYQAAYTLLAGKVQRDVRFVEGYVPPQV